MKEIAFFLLLITLRCDKIYNLHVNGKINFNINEKEVVVIVKNNTRTCNGGKFRTDNGEYSVDFSCLHMLPSEIFIYGRELDTIMLKITEKTGEVYINQNGRECITDFKKTRSTFYIKYDIFM
ncbi:MAG: hypothetical protein JW915_14120 [Chitinispirillaceae bacterium]|nr:hypothetical protein [Chitinispirillaceae bacterium]